LIKNLVATVSGEPLMFPASGFLDKNSSTSFKGAPKPVPPYASPLALTFPGLFAKPTLEKSTV